MPSFKNVSVFRFVLHALRPFIPFVVGQMIIGVLWAMDLSYRPYIVKMILNKAAVINPANAFDELLPWVYLYMTMMIVMVCFYRIHDWLWLKVAAPFRKYTGMLIMDRMLDQSHYFYQNNFSGAVSNKINDVIGHSATLVKIFLDAFFSHGISVIIAIYAVYSVAWYFAAGLFVWVTIFLIIAISFSMKGAALSDDAASRRTKVVGTIVDVLANMMSVRLFGGKKTEMQYLDQQLDEYVTTDQEMKWFYIIIYSLQGISFIIFQIFCFWKLIQGFRDGVITPGDFSLIMSINLNIVSNLWYLSKDIKDFAEAFGNVSQGLRIMQAPIDVKDAPDAVPLKVTGGSITFEHVQFHYKEALPFFQDKSVTIKAGQTVALVGESGSGKSTFANLILRLYDVNSGRILIDGQDIKKVTQESLRAAIAMIPQDPSLFHRSLLENIRYGKPKATDEEVIDAAKRAHAHEFIVQQKDGYETMVGERGSRLSGGQRQRIAIARAFLRDGILILDEATSQLDSLTEGEIQKSLKDLMKNRTTLVIAHRLSTIEGADRILVFHQGQIVEDGNHQELLAKNGYYARLYHAQVGGMLPTSINGTSAPVA